MRSFVVLAILFSFPFTASGQSAGIENSNYKVGVSGGNSDIGNRYTLLGEARFPVANYTGLSLSVSLAEFNGKNYFIDSSSKSAGLGVFFRKYDLGIIQARYGYSKSEVDISPDTLTNSADSYLLSGIWYLNRFDVLLSRTKSKADNRSSVDASVIGGSYYVNDDLRLGISLAEFEEDDSYGAFLSYQPKIFNNVLGLSFGYQNSNDIDFYSFTISYFFKTKVSLLDRNRRY